MHKNEKGIALILVIIVVTMVSLLLTSYVAVTISERKRVEHELAAASAEYIARVGLEQAFFDLSCEYEKDRSWPDPAPTAPPDYPNAANTINGVSAAVPDLTAAATFVDIDNTKNYRTDFQPFYPIDVPPGTFNSGAHFGAGEYSGDYRLWIAFSTNETSVPPNPPAVCPSASCALTENRLWVKSTGRVMRNGATMDTVTLTQLARVKSLALVEIQNPATTRDLVEIERLYDFLDKSSDSAVDNLAAATNDHELRIAGEDIDGNVLIDQLNGATLTIRGGYGFDFSDGSRDTSKNVSTLKDAGGDPVVTLSGAGTVTMGGVRIE